MGDLELAVGCEEAESFIFGRVFLLLSCAGYCWNEGVAASLGYYNTVLPVLYLRNSHDLTGDGLERILVFQFG